MSRNRGSECCEYREEKRRLARQKLRMTMEASKVAKKKLFNDCDDEDEEADIEQERKCEEKRAQRIEALTKILSLGDEMMRRIKPSIEERDKYSMSYRHIRCFLEPEEIERMELEKKMRRFYQCMPCETVENQRRKFDKYQIPSTPKRKKKKKRKKKDKQKESDAKEVVDEQEEEEEAENKTDSATENEEEEPGPGKKKEESKKDEEKPKDKKQKPSNESEFWCRKVKKKVKPKRDERQFELDCKDSICSFDSEYDLTGLALTKEDLKKIAEKRRSKIASKSKNKT